MPDGTNPAVPLTDMRSILEPSSKPVAEIARKVRVALKRVFPCHLTRFSVRSQGSPALLRVRWCGGPIEEDVERVVNAVTSGTQVSVVYARWVFAGVSRVAPA